MAQPGGAFFCVFVGAVRCPFLTAFFVHDFSVSFFLTFDVHFWGEWWRGNECRPFCGAFSTPVARKALFIFYFLLLFWAKRGAHPKKFCSIYFWSARLWLFMLLFFSGSSSSFFFSSFYYIFILFYFIFYWMV